MASHHPLNDAPDAPDRRLATASDVVGRGDGEGVERVLRTALMTGDQQLSRDHAELGRLLHDLALFYLRDGRLDEAEPLLLRLYYMKCRTSGRMHPEAADVLATLASLRQAQDRHDDAEAMWRQVVAVRERHVGPADPATVAAMQRLAESCRARGKHREAGCLLAEAAGLRQDLVVASPPSSVGLVLSSPPAHAMSTPPRRAPSAEPSAPTPLYPAEWPLAHGSIAAHPSTQAALRAIQAELLAAERAGGDSRFARVRWAAALRGGGRRAAALLVIAAAAVLMLSFVAAGSRAAGTLGMHPDVAPPTWEVWTPPAPLNPPRDSALDRAAASGDSARPAATADSSSDASAPRTARTRVSARGGAVTTSDAYEVRLAADPPARRAPSQPVAAAVGVVHARLIGPVPRPAYPEILSDRRLEGDVVVRFAVDEQGVPDTASLLVVRTPHDVLTDAVRRVIPGLRFEPARRASPDATPERDVVEMAFPFVWRAP